jgi:2-dehydropantoate 2-reductase
MRTLIYGAGPLGSLIAARLHAAGQDVSLLARRQRLADLRTHGVVLEAADGRREVQHVPVVEEYTQDDRYDLVVVVMRKNQALQILANLDDNPHADTILFLMNNPAGPSGLVRVLGADRVMSGFPTMGGYREGHVMHVVTLPFMSLPIGEVDGRVTARTLRVAAVLNAMRDKRVKIRTDMDAWLVTHVSGLMALLGVYAADLDPGRFARTRDAIVLGLRARQEAMRAQQACGIPISPRYFHALPWIPEPMALATVRAVATSSTMKTGLFGHAAAARDEIQHLLGEFRGRVAGSGVPTPALDALSAYVAHEEHPMPDGSRQLPLRWGGVLALGGALALSAGAYAYGRRRSR